MKSHLLGWAQGLLECPGRGEEGAQGYRAEFRETGHWLLPRGRPQSTLRRRFKFRPISLSAPNQLSLKTAPRVRGYCVVGLRGGSWWNEHHRNTGRDLPSSFWSFLSKKVHPMFYFPAFTLETGSKKI